MHNRVEKATGNGRGDLFTTAAVFFTFETDARHSVEEDPAVITSSSGLSVISPAPAPTAIHRATGPMDVANNHDMRPTRANCRGSSTFCSFQTYI